MSKRKQPKAGSLRKGTRKATKLKQCQEKRSEVLTKRKGLGIWGRPGRSSTNGDMGSSVVGEAKKRIPSRFACIPFLILR